MTTPAEKLKVSDIPPTTLRLPPELRDLLAREATMNGRSLSQEITLRLKASLEGKPHSHRPQPLSTVVHTGEPAGPALGDSQRQLLTLFNALPPEKQLSLLTLLRR